MSTWALSGYRPPRLGALTSSQLTQGDNHIEGAHELLRALNSDIRNARAAGVPDVALQAFEGAHQRLHDRVQNLAFQLVDLEPTAFPRWLSEMERAEGELTRLRETLAMTLPAGRQVRNLRIGGSVLIGLAVVAGIGAGIWWLTR